MSNKVLIVVDMQNDFVTKGGKLALPHDTTPMIDKMYDYISNFADDGGKIVYTLDTHNKDACEFKTFPRHCVAGTWGANLHPTIAQVMEERNGRMLWKHSFSGKMVSTYLTDTHPNAEFYVVGVCTHICVHDTVSDLVNTFKNKLDILPTVKIVKDLVDDFDPEMAEFSLKRLVNLYGVKLI